MGILGIGVDVVHLPRIAALMKRRTAHKLALRILSESELEDWQMVVSRTEPAQQARFLAVRWSVKEAAYKALFPYVVPTWKEITYKGFDPNHRVKPSLEYRPLLPTQNRVGKIHSSVSHDGEYVFTSVLAEEFHNGSNS